MTYSPAIQQAVAKIQDLSVVAHREVEAVLPAIAAHGEAETLQWLAACQALFSFERDAGKAFIRGSLDAEKVSEEVLPWTAQAMAFMQWRASWRALEGFMANLARAYGSLGHAGEQRWAEIGFGWCARQIESGAAYFSTSVLDLSGRQRQHLHHHPTAQGCNGCHHGGCPGERAGQPPPEAGRCHAGDR